MGENESDHVARLYREFVDAEEAGGDIESDVLTRAGKDRQTLRARIRLHRQVQAIGKDIQLVATAASPPPPPPPQPSPPEGPARDPALPRAIGRFTILRVIARGGLGVVYEAFDPKLARRIALKVLTRQVVAERAESAWLLNEARSLARLEHKNVVKVFEVGEADGQTYLAMELLSGPSLAQVIKELRRARSDAPAEDVPDTVRALAERLTPFPARIECLRQIAEALSYCHDHGVLHRDIKPENLLFDASGCPKLIDFGLAHDEGADEDSRLNLTQNLVGTAAYIAPEQVENNRTGADPRSDQFSFSTVAYEFLALENPFHRRTQGERMDAISRCQPRPLREVVPALPPDLMRVVRHGHERLPESRYPDMQAMAEDLRAILAHHPISVSAPSLGHLGRLWVRRHRRVVALGTLLTFVLVSVGISAWAAGTWLRHDGIRGELESIHPEGFEKARQFDETSQVLLDLQRRARDFDAGWLRTRLWGVLGPRIDPVVRTWLSRLVQCYERDAAASRASGLPFQAGLYKQLFTFAGILCPDCEEGRDYRDRGKVNLPRAEAEKHRFGFDQVVPMQELRESMISVFRPSEIETFLAPGVYRLRVWDDGEDRLRFESVFLVGADWPPAKDVRLRPGRTEFLESSKTVARSNYPIRNGHLVVPEFLMLDHFVTFGEFEGFRQETNDHGSASNERGSDPTAPVHVDFETAMRMAEWAGGRLPWAVELVVVGNTPEAQREIDVPDLVEEAEYVLDLTFEGDSMSTHSFFRHKSWKPGNPPVLSPVVYPTQVSRTSAREAVFRIVFSGDAPELYQQLVSDPIEELPLEGR